LYYLDIEVKVIKNIRIHVQQTLHRMHSIELADLSNILSLDVPGGSLNDQRRLDAQSLTG